MWTWPVYGPNLAQIDTRKPKMPALWGQCGEIEKVLADIYSSNYCVRIEVDAADGAP